MSDKRGLISIIWLIFAIIFFLLGCYHLQASKNNISPYPIPSSEMQVGGIINQHVVKLNKLNTRQNQMAAYGYFGAAATACFSMYLVSPGIFKKFEKRKELIMAGSEKAKTQSTANVNVLYKYCGQRGIEIILRTLELKLPYISDVNDPYECSPIFNCPDDKTAIEEYYLFRLKLKGITPPADYRQKIKHDEMREKFIDGAKESLKSVNETSSLLSVSKTANNPVMWAHYTEQHKGAVIGIDFDNVFPDTNRPSKLVMHPIKPSKKRLKINVLSEFMLGELKKVPFTKSIDWKYEGEFRSVLPVEFMEGLRQIELARLGDYDGKDAWFLKLNPASIKEVVFGLDTGSDLKSKIRKLIERPDLQHIKLRQAEESETYTLNLR
ncbi:MAG TPA: DUF2971 domain-containing protein [Phycisphaerales bacterium]|nr:DUF2971 domain-containing protein [Phycisphaerales bacterium]